MEPSLPKAREEVAELLRYARTKGFEEDALQPWDLPYWAERYRKAYYDLDDALLKPYFRLEDCIDAVFGLAGKLYGLRFEERTDIPGYHKDVRVYDVLTRRRSAPRPLLRGFLPQEEARRSLDDGIPGPVQRMGRRMSPDQHRDELFQTHAGHPFASDARRTDDPPA